MLIDQEQKPEVSKSKYELTLAEFPLVVLSKRKSDEMRCIVYEDTIRGDKNQLVKRTWKVFPSKHGFGTESTLETLFDLFQVWKETGFYNQYVHFGSVYGLLKRRGISTEGKEKYDRIVRDLQCLVGMTIEATNAFWDNEKQAYVDKTFHLFDDLTLYKEKPTGQATLPLAYIKASDVLYGSIQKNSVLIANFDSQFFHSLKPVEQRMALYFSKVFRSQSVHKRELSEFAEQIPILAKETKKVKQTIKLACEGLIKKGFRLLEGVSFEKGIDRKTEMVVFSRKPGVMPKYLRELDEPRGMEEAELELLVEDILEVCKDEKSRHFYRKVARLMDASDIYRTLSEVKEIRDTGTVQKTKGAIFTNLIRKYAQERGIDL